MPQTRRVEAPAIVYTQSGDVSIAYAISGQGPPDIVFVHGYIGNLEVEWEEPGHVAFFTKLAAANRVIRFDRRGSGLSDRVRDVPTLETRMDDLRAVMDAAASARAVLVATFEAAAMAMLFAATYPERVAGLVLFYPLARACGRRTIRSLRPKTTTGTSSSRSGPAGAGRSKPRGSFARRRRSSPATRSSSRGRRECSGKERVQAQRSHFDGWS